MDRKYQLAFACVALLGLAASTSDGPPPLPIPHKSALVERGAGAKQLTAKPAVVMPPRQYKLAWTNPATNQVVFSNWTTIVICSTNLRTWQTWTNLPFTATNTAAIPAGRFWRVGYTKS
jgi:hypothetical protein